MKRFVGVCGATVAALAVAVPIAVGNDGGGGGPTTKPAVTCARTVFAARILRVGADALAVRPLQSETGKPLVVRLTADTVVKQGDTVVDPSALAAGKQARFLVRVCRSADRRLVTARVITLAADTPSVDPGAPSSPAPSTEPRTEPPPPTTEVCGQGETDTVLVAVSDGSITVRTTSSEGTKEWSVTVDGDTVIRKSDQNVSLSALKPGDFVHVVLVRCPSAGTVRALRIVFLHAATTSA